MLGRDMHSHERLLVLLLIINLIFCNMYIISTIPIPVWAEYDVYLCCAWQLQCTAGTHPHWKLAAGNVLCRFCASDCVLDLPTPEGWKAESACCLSVHACLCVCLLFWIWKHSGNIHALSPCSYVARKIEHIYKSHNLMWWNFCPAKMLKVKLLDLGPVEPHYLIKCFFFGKNFTKFCSQLSDWCLVHRSTD